MQNRRRHKQRVRETERPAHEEGEVEKGRRQEIEIVHTSSLLSFSCCSRQERHSSSDVGSLLQHTLPRFLPLSSSFCLSLSLSALAPTPAFTQSLHTLCITASGETCDEREASKRRPATTTSADKDTSECVSGHRSFHSLLCLFARASHTPFAD